MERGEEGGDRNTTKGEQEMRVGQEKAKLETWRERGGREGTGRKGLARGAARARALKVGENMCGGKRVVGQQ